MAIHTKLVMNLGEDHRSVVELVSSGITCDLCKGTNLKCEVVTYRRVSGTAGQIRNVFHWLCWNCTVAD